MRDAAFCSAPYEIAGVKVRVMTLQDLVNLSAGKSPLVCGGTVKGLDVVNFLWALSPDFDATEDGRKVFIAMLPDLQACYQDCLEYLEFIFLDAPKTGSDGPIPAVSHVACAIDFLVTEYRWTKAESLACEMPQIFQFQRAADLRKGGKPSAATVNMAKSAYLEALNKQPVEHHDRWTRDQVRALEKERKSGRI